VTIGGEFWMMENPDRRVRGDFTAEVGNKPELTLAARVVADPPPAAKTEPGDLGAALTAYAAQRVAAFQPITLHGQLDTGESITLLHAQNHGRPGDYPRYVAFSAIWDANAAPDELYSAVRFRLDHPFWLGHLTDGESSVVEDDGSTLSVQASEDGNWLVYESSAPATLGQLEIRVISGCLVLVQLALYPDKDLVTRETQVRVGSDGRWLTVSGPGFCAEPGSARLDTLLPRGELTVERFASWIERNDCLDGLAWAVARPGGVVLQMQTQVLTSLVEGLHRRLPFFAQSWFPDVPKKKLKRVREAAANAAANEAEEQGLDRDLVLDLVTKALGHVGDVSYRDRAEAVVAMVCAAVPEIAESVTNLPARLTDPRHSFAHHLPQDEAKEPLEVRVRRWTVVSYVTPWLLRTLLLLHAGVEPDVLHTKYLEFQRFAFFRANVAQLVRELEWELPSAAE
jgi:hypothetical protein